MKEFLAEVLDDQREVERWRSLAEPSPGLEWNLDALTGMVRKLRSKQSGIDTGS